MGGSILRQIEQWFLAGYDFLFFLSSLLSVSGLLSIIGIST
jgi:hypothetical protein